MIHFSYDFNLRMLHFSKLVKSGSKVDFDNRGGMHFDPLWYFEKKTMLKPYTVLVKKFILIHFEISYQYVQKMFENGSKRLLMRFLLEKFEVDQNGVL